MKYLGYRFDKSHLHSHLRLGVCRMWVCVSLGVWLCFCVYIFCACTFNGLGIKRYINKTKLNCDELPINSIDPYRLMRPVFVSIKRVKFRLSYIHFNNKKIGLKSNKIHSICCCWIVINETCMQGRSKHSWAFARSAVLCRHKTFIFLFGIDASSSKLGSATPRDWKKNCLKSFFARN